MARFSTGRRGVNRTTTYEGAPATYIQDPRANLVSQVLTTFVNEPKFYGRTDEHTDRLKHSIKVVLDKDPKFVANLARYARNHLHMRSVTHLLVGELAAHPKGKPYVRNLIPIISHRPDDLTEILAYYLNTYGKPIPNSLKKGLADAFAYFNEYQLEKYNRKRDIKLKDILCLCHPKPVNSVQSDVWKRLLEDNLEVPYTWETQLSTRGNTKEVWEELIDSKKVGYMALLRNLRNILEADPNNLQEVLNYLADPEAVRKSKQLPFRFYAAYREILQPQSTFRYFGHSRDRVDFSTNAALITLETAIEHSTDNLETIPGRTVLVNDDSGSMTWNTISNRSTITTAEIAALMLSISHKLCEKNLVGSFSNDFRLRNLDPRGGIINNTLKLVEASQGGATYMENIFEFLLNHEIATDRIIVFSDNEAHGYPHRLWQQYTNNVAPNAWLHLIDLAGYGHQIIHGDRVTYTPGWSEKVLQFIMLAETNITDIVLHIDQL